MTLLHAFCTPFAAFCRLFQGRLRRSGRFSVTMGSALNLRALHFN
jgi:hypothetical protein